MTRIYELSPADLQAIAKDAAVGRAIWPQRTRRVRTGLAAKELAAKYFVAGPEIRNTIASAAESNPRHKIDALKELRATASGSDGEGPSKGELFSIVINLGSDIGDRIEKTFDMPKSTPPQLEDNVDGNDWG